MFFPDQKRPPSFAEIEKALRLREMCLEALEAIINRESAEHVTGYVTWNTIDKKVGISHSTRCRLASKYPGIFSDITRFLHATNKRRKALFGEYRDPKRKRLALTVIGRRITPIA